MAYLNKALSYYNQDVELLNRGVKSKGYTPDQFMTFYFDQFAEYEKINYDLKVLLDRIRVYSLLRFRLENACHERVNVEIKKVDFHNVGKRYWFYYKAPYFMVWVYSQIKVLMSFIKSCIYEKSAKKNI